MSDHIIEAHDDIINETYDTVIINGISFDPSQILKELDPIAYDLSLQDFENSQDNDEEE